MLEVSMAKDAIYRPHSIGLHPIGFRVRQRAPLIDGVTGLPWIITGLRRLTFDGEEPSVVIAASDHWWRDEGNFGWLEMRTNTGAPAPKTPGLSLEAIQLHNHYILANGVDQQVVFKKVDGEISVLAHGMQPLAGVDFDGDAVDGVTNCEISTALVTAVTGTWQGPLPGPAYYYWITEYDSVNGIESPAMGSDGTVGLVQWESPVSTQFVGITIKYGGDNYPTLVNPNATHWRVYRGIGDIFWWSTAPFTWDEAINRANPFPVGVRPTVYDLPDIDLAIGYSQVEIPTDAQGHPIPAEKTVYDFGMASETPYPQIVIQESGVISSVSRDDPPLHKFNTADTFQDSVVTNDMSDRSLVRYSVPSLPHSWPSLYWINFDTKQSDVVTCIKALGQIMIVGLEHQIWRINYLPRAGDPDFSRGRVKDLVAGDHGIVGPNAATSYTLPGGIPRIAYVSETGLNSTDGLTYRPLTRDIDWAKTLNQNELAGSILLNAQRLQSLILFYVPLGEGSQRLQALFFSYAPEHLKNGMLKVSGPVSIAAASADYDANSGEIWTGGYAGQVRTEDERLTDDNEEYAELISTTGMTVRTRIMHLGGLDGESEIERVWLLTEQPPPGQKDWQVEAVHLIKREIDDVIQLDDFGSRFETGKLTRIEMHATSGGLGAEVHGFAPLTMVGFEHVPRKGT
jgi:hypothetical protein